MKISHVDDVWDVGCIWLYDIYPIYPMIFPLTGYESSWLPHASGHAKRCHKASWILLTARPKVPWMRIAVPSFSWTTCARRSGVWVHWTWTLGAAMPIRIRRSGMAEDWHVGTLALSIWDHIRIYIYAKLVGVSCVLLVMSYPSHGGWNHVKEKLPDVLEFTGWIHHPRSPYFFEPFFWPGIFADASSFCFKDERRLSCRKKGSDLFTGWNGFRL